MNREEVCGHLNWLHAQCMKQIYHINEHYEEVETWLEVLKYDVAKALKHKGTRLVVPTTPGGIRKRMRRRLSVIQESDNDVTECMPSKRQGIKKVVMKCKSFRRITRSSAHVKKQAVEEDISDNHVTQISTNLSTCSLKSILVRKEPIVLLKRISDLGKRQTKSGSIGKRTSKTRSSKSVIGNEIKDIRASYLNDQGIEIQEFSKVIEASAVNLDDEVIRSSISTGKLESETQCPSLRQCDPKGSRVTYSNVQEVSEIIEANSVHLNKEVETCSETNILHPVIENTVSDLQKICKSNELSQVEQEESSLSSKLENINPVDQSCDQLLQIAPTVQEIQNIIPIINNMTENVEMVNGELGNNTERSQASSAYFSMDNPNCSSYLTAASQNETSHLRPSANNAQSSIENVAPKQNIKSTNLIKLPSKVLKSPNLFSPYANDSVKKRVAAYEQLNTISSEVMKTTKRVTRSKARAMILCEADKNIFLKQRSKMNTSQNQARTSLKRALKILANKNEASKENSFLYSSKKTHITPGARVLSEVNIMSTSQSQLNNILATKSAHKPGVVILGTETFIKKPPKQTHTNEIKKQEELKRRILKEKEAEVRRAEMLKKRAEDQRKKEEKRQRVLQNREAQERDKQERKLRVERERDGKLNILHHGREAKQKNQVIKKKTEMEKKAADAQRKIDEAEEARLAKLKMDSTFLIPSDVAPKKNLRSTFKSKCSTLKNDIYNLEELKSDESSDSDDEKYNKTAPWAKRPRLQWESELEQALTTKINKMFVQRDLNMFDIFPGKSSLKRTSSAKWDTPPRYSCLPKY